MGFSEPNLDVGLQQKSLQSSTRHLHVYWLFYLCDHEVVLCTDRFCGLGASIRTEQHVVARYTHLTLERGSLYPSRSVPVAVSFWHQSAWQCFSCVLAPLLGALGR